MNERDYMHSLRSLPSEYMPSVGNWIVVIVMWIFIMLLNVGALVFNAVVGFNWVCTLNVAGVVMAPVLIYKARENYRDAIRQRAEVRKRRYERALNTPVPPLPETVTWPEYERQVERMLRNAEDPWSVQLDPEQVTALAMAERRKQESELAYRNGPDPEDSLEAYQKQFGDQIANLYRLPPPQVGRPLPFGHERDDEPPDFPMTTIRG